jgi:hypothetical protein
MKKTISIFTELETNNNLLRLLCAGLIITNLSTIALAFHLGNKQPLVVNVENGTPSSIANAFSQNIDEDELIAFAKRFINNQLSTNVYTIDNEYLEAVNMLSPTLKKKWIPIFQKLATTIKEKGKEQNIISKVEITDCIVNRNTEPYEVIICSQRQFIKPVKNIEKYNLLLTLTHRKRTEKNPWGISISEIQELNEQEVAQLKTVSQ